MPSVVYLNSIVGRLPMTCISLLIPIIFCVNTVDAKTSDSLTGHWQFDAPANLFSATVGTDLVFVGAHSAAGGPDESNGAAQIADIPVGDISAPIEINGVYFIFQIVDIRRDPLMIDEYKTSAERYRQILFYREVRKGAMEFVSTSITPTSRRPKKFYFRRSIHLKQIIL